MGALEGLEDQSFAVGASHLACAGFRGEVLTYVRAGVVEYVDSVGSSGTLRAGDVQRRTADPGLSHRETNPSLVDGAHVVRLRLLPTVGAVTAPDLETRWFGVAARRGTLLVIASADGLGGSVRLRADVCVRSAVYDTGRHVVYAIAPERGVRFHVLHGDASVGTAAVHAGDSLTVVAERSLSFTVRAPTEILLIDIDARVGGASAPRSSA